MAVFMLERGLSRLVFRIRSLRNDVDDGYEDFIQKYKFALFISFRNYFTSFRVVVTVVVIVS